jgi:RNA polymerase sigma factor (sigma-70 family)
MAAQGDDDAPAAKATDRGVAVEDAYRHHAALLREIAEFKFNIPPADAESIVNDVFTSFMVRSEQVRSPRKWLIGAVCHASRAYWRIAARTSPLAPGDDYIDPRADGLEETIVDRVTMAAALAQLGPKCRETLRMYYAEGYSAAEIAAQLGTTSGYVMQLLHSCRKRVREAYDAVAKDRKK